MTPAKFNAYGDPLHVEGMLACAVGDDELNVQCPACGELNSHIIHVVTRVGREGDRPYPGTAAQGISGWGRHALVILFVGECAHTWELIIQQCKGSNTLFLGRIAEWPAEDEDGPDWED